MLSHEEMLAWVAARFGPKHAETRTTDGGFAFWIDTQPDAYHDGDKHAATYGNGSVVVVRATGEAWFLNSTPDSLPVYEATSGADLMKRLTAAHYNAKIPDEIIGEDRADPPDPAAQQVDHHYLARWLRSVGWQEPACRITDLVYAFMITPAPAVANGPIVVVKRTAGIWYLGTSPVMLAAVDAARSEAEFYAALRSVEPDADPRVPHDRVPQWFAHPFS